VTCVGQVRGSRKAEPGVELGGGVVGIEGVELDLIKSETAGDMSEADHELLAPTLEDVLGVNAESWL
jgi:hypothetical protein